MTQEIKTNEPLDLLASKIEAHAKKSDEHVISAAMLMREARQRIDDGELGDGVKWYAWARKNIKLSESRLRDLQRIAEADDPAQELERQRKQTQKRVEGHREKKAAEKRGLEPERRDLIAWAKKAPIEEVRRILARIPGNDNAAVAAEDQSGADSEAAA